MERKNKVNIILLLIYILLCQNNNCKTYQVPTTYNIYLNKNTHTQQTHIEISHIHGFRKVSLIKSKPIFFPLHYIFIVTNRNFGCNLYRHL